MVLTIKEELGSTVLLPFCSSGSYNYVHELRPPQREKALSTRFLASKQTIGMKQTAPNSYLAHMAIMLPSEATGPDTSIHILEYFFTHCPCQVLENTVRGIHKV